jgi:membrane associated rhomboid family serine protease
MAGCQNCGREFAGGSSCPYCGAPNLVATAVSMPGVVVGHPTRRAGISPTHIIVGINVLVFMAMVLTGASPINPSRQQLLRWGANWGPLSLGTQPWRILTSNYVHVGIIHLGFNMWCLWNLGYLAERVLGRLNYVLLYTFCGVAGSLASLWWHPMVVGAGASGAIFGLAGAAIAVFYLGHLPIARDAIRSTMRSLIMFVAYNLFFGLIPGIDNSAHIGGLTAGLAMGAVLAKHILVPPQVRRVWTRVTWIVMAGILLVANVGLRHLYSQLPLLASPHAVADQQLASARRALEQRNPEKAVAQLQGVIAEEPRAAEPRYLLGEAYLMQHQPDPAISAFQETLRLDPRYAAAAAGLGSAYLAKGMKAEAAEAFKEAAALGYQGN